MTKTKQKQAAETLIDSVSLGNVYIDSPDGLYTASLHPDLADTPIRIRQVLDMGITLAEDSATLAPTALASLRGILGRNREQLETVIPLWMLDEDEMDTAEGLRRFMAFGRLAGLTGLLAEMETPVPIMFSADFRDYRCSWGYTTSYWFYADTVEQIRGQAHHWRLEYLERKRRDAVQ